MVFQYGSLRDWNPYKKERDCKKIHLSGIVRFSRCFFPSRFISTCSSLILRHRELSEILTYGFNLQHIRDFLYITNLEHLKDVQTNGEITPKVIL